jgi:hypothetical protein
MDFKRMNVFASADEISHIKGCANAPVMGMTNPEPPGPGVSPVVPMFESPQVAAHRYALGHGLPEIPGYYGIDLSNGEFIKV